MSIRDLERRVLRASPAVPAVTGGAVLRPCAGSAAWQGAGNGMNDGRGREPAAGSAMR